MYSVTNNIVGERIALAEKNFEGRGVLLLPNEEGLEKPREWEGGRWKKRMRQAEGDEG